MMEMVISQTAHTKELKIEDIPITQYHLDHQIQIMTNEAFIIEGHSDHVIDFMLLVHINTPVMSFIPAILLLITCKHHHMSREQFTGAINYHPS